MSKPFLVKQTLNCKTQLYKLKLKILTTPLSYFHFAQGSRKKVSPLIAGGVTMTKEKIRVLSVDKVILGDQKP